MHKYHISLKSENAKTGPIPVTTTSKDSCPKTCPFYSKGCYAKSGPLNVHWNKVGENRNIPLTLLLAHIKSFAPNQLWRHNQAGDLPNYRGKINKSILRRFIRANKGKRGFTYTHHLPTKENISIIKEANDNGFTVNLSANNLNEAVKLKKKTKQPVVCIVPSDIKEKSFTHKGEKVVVCPATYNDSVNCVKCGLCQKANRNSIVAFPAHGTQKSFVNEVVG